MTTGGLGPPRTPRAVPLRSTVADVDLDAIASNMAVLRDRAKAEIIAVVKDDAYGHGVEAVSEALVDAGAAMLAVFTVEEAVTLRRAGVSAPVLVLSGAADRAEADAAIVTDSALVVWDTGHARMLAEAAAAAGRTAHVHFKVDTGLTRLGAPVAEAAGRYRAIRELRGVEVDGIFTHLASADEPDLATAREQLARFAGVLDGIGEPPRWVHAAASSGVASFGLIPRCTAARPGVSLYGIHTAAHLKTALALRPAMSWRSRVLRVADARKGQGVSYGHEYRMPRDGRVATVPVGYGDGLPRVAAMRGRVLLRGHALPIAGRVCMDLIMLDITDIPDAAEGDEVVLIGEQGGARLVAEDLADAAGTIAYEITTGVRRRVPRRYLRGGRVVALRTLAEGYRRR